MFCVNTHSRVCPLSMSRKSFKPILMFSEMHKSRISKMQDNNHDILYATCGGHLKKIPYIFLFVNKIAYIRYL